MPFAEQCEPVLSADLVGGSIGETVKPMAAPVPEGVRSRDTRTREHAASNPR